ncbi:retrovirus-related pol polyprotein from transposon TNT 1-94 [Tanacetum coccineum]
MVGFVRMFKGDINQNSESSQGKLVKCYNCNGVRHIARNCTQPKRPQNSDYFKDKMLLTSPENGAVLDEENLLFIRLVKQDTPLIQMWIIHQSKTLALNEDHISKQKKVTLLIQMFDEEPTAQTIILWPNFVTNQDEHEIHNEVQQSNVIDSTSVYMGNSNVIPYEQYLSVNNISIVPSCTSSTLNNVCVSSDNDAFVPHDPIANELKIYKEQVAIYEQRAKFELTERE